MCDLKCSPSPSMLPEVQLHRVSVTQQISSRIGPCSSADPGVLDGVAR